MTIGEFFAELDRLARERGLMKDGGSPFKSMPKPVRNTPASADSGQANKSDDQLVITDDDVPF